MTDHYVSAEGVYIGGFGDGANPETEGLVNLGDNPPEYADQIWLFPGWSESPSRLVADENAWREEEMPTALQNVTALDFGEEDIPGTAQQWQKYWLALRKWTPGNPDFPDSSKRPVAPT